MGPPVLFGVSAFKDAHVVHDHYTPLLTALFSKLGDMYMSARTRQNATSWTVRVTQEHIDYACSRNSSHCMIADAIKDSIKGSSRGMVDLQSCRFSKNHRRLICFTPPVAQKAIIAFDRGDKSDIKPFTLRLKATQIIDNSAHRKVENTPKKQAQNRKWHMAAKRRRTRATKAVMAYQNAARGNVGVKMGGTALPVASPGTRREFGIRALRS